MRNTVFIGCVDINHICYQLCLENWTEPVSIDVNTFCYSEHVCFQNSGNYWDSTPAYVISILLSIVFAKRCVISNCEFLHMITGKYVGNIVTLPIYLRLNVQIFCQERAVAFCLFEVIHNFNLFCLFCVLEFFSHIGHFVYQQTCCSWGYFTNTVASKLLTNNFSKKIVRRRQTSQTSEARTS